MAGTEIYSWLMLAEEHASKNPAMSYKHVLVPNIITEFECYECGMCVSETKYETIPVAALYPPDKEFMVRIGGNGAYQLIIPKIRGVEWIPLIMKTQHVYVHAGQNIMIKPKPKAMLVLEIQPNGQTIFQMWRW